MTKVSISDLAKFISQKHGLSQEESKTFITTLFDVINDGLYNEKSIKVKGLGTFKIIDVRERESVNINTGKRVMIESHSKITFTPDPIMRDLVNKPFAQFETVILNEGVNLEELEKTQIESNEIDRNIEIYEDKFKNHLIENSKSKVYEQIPEKTNEQELKDKKIIASEIEKDTLQNERIEMHNIINQEKRSTIQTTVTEERNNTETILSGEDTINNDTNNGCFSNYKNIIYIICLIIIACITTTIGFYWGRNTVKPIIKYKTVHIIKKPITRKVIPVNQDTIKKTDSLKKWQNIEKNKIKQQNIANNKSTILRNAQAMVNTGAYNIIGTANTVTVKKGENLKKISKFYLGEGMECYILVHNGIDDIHEGMKIKIPKLKLKKTIRRK